MKRRLALGLALPLTIGMLAIGGGLMRSAPTHIFAAASTPPPPPSFIPTPITPPPPPPTNTPTATPIPTSTPVPTATQVPPTPTDTPTEVPPAQPTNTPVPPAPTPAKTKVLNTGAGGTYQYSSASAGKLSKAAQSRVARSNTSKAGITSRSASNGPTQLPRTGGGSGAPESPLAPLALLAAAAIGLSRFLKR